MRELWLLGAIALAFGLGSTYASSAPGLFRVANLVAGGVALLASAVLALRRARGAAAPGFRRVFAIGLGRIGATVLVAGLAVHLASRSGLQFDWTFERKFELSEATLGVLHDLCGELDASIYHAEFDPRLRATRLLLRTMEKTGCLTFDERRLDEHPDEEDRYEIGTSNTVVLKRRGADGQVRFETVERPTEGSLYEALYRLREQDRRAVLYVAQGAGEGDVESTTPIGYSGLAAALDTEGYEVRAFVSAGAVDIPDSVAAVLWIDPERPLRPEALAGLRDYLMRGGRLVAFLEPGRQTGLEALLAEWGLASPDQLVVDPASAPVLGDARGLDPLVYSYATRNPAAHGLGPGRMTLFRGARSFVLHKPEPDDRIEGVAFASPRSWLDPDLRALDSSRSPEPPPGVDVDYHPLLVTGSYLRGGKEIRIAAFGDSDLASNRFLRTLYNLDLVLNTVHWAAAREPAITLRPKSSVSGGMQFPLPIQNTFSMFNGLGLLLPELLLIAGALVWSRQRHG